MTPPLRFTGLTRETSCTARDERDRKSSLRNSLDIPCRRTHLIGGSDQGFWSESHVQHMGGTTIPQRGSNPSTAFLCHSKAISPYHLHRNPSHVFGKCRFVLSYLVGFTTFWSSGRAARPRTRRTCAGERLPRSRRSWLRIRNTPDSGVPCAGPSSASSASLRPLGPPDTGEQFFAICHTHICGHERDVHGCGRGVASMHVASAAARVPRPGRSVPTSGVPEVAGRLRVGDHPDVVIGIGVCVLVGD